MNVFMGEGAGRVLKLSIQRGEKLLESIEQELIKQGITDAVVVSGIGTLDRLVYHRVTSLDPSPKEEFITIDSPLELCSVQGLVAAGKPHLHLVASDEAGTYAGHLEPGCTVLYLAEIVLLETRGEKLKRVRDENKLMQLTQKA